MKLSNKILMGGVALLLASSVIMFTGCPQEIGVGDIEGGTINATNTDSDYQRTFQSTKTNHYGATCKITINNQPSTSTNGDGVMGMFFDYSTPSSTNKKLHNFAAVGVRLTKNKTLQAYVSYFTGVNEDYFQNGVSFLGDSTNTVGDEYEVLKGEGTASYYDLKTNYTVSTDGDCVVTIKVEQDKDTGDFKVSFLDSANKEIKKDIKITNTIRGDKGYSQAYIGYYANVYNGCTLKGSWKFTDIKGNPVIFDAE